MLLKRVTAVTLAMGAMAAAGPVAPALASPVSTSATYTLKARSPRVIDVGAVDVHSRITLARGHGTTTWARGCGPACSTSYADGRIGGSRVPCASDCLAPGLPVGAIVYKVGRHGTWTLYNGSPNKIQSDVRAHVYVAYNDDHYADNRGSYVDLFVAREPLG